MNDTMNKLQSRPVSPVHGGFSLIELMIVVSILGIMLMIAVPSYTNFVTRAKMTELVSVMMRYKLDVSEHVGQTGSFPETGNKTDFKNINNLSKYIAQLRFRKVRDDTFFIEARPSSRVHPDLKPKHSIVIRAKKEENAHHINWECGTYKGRTSQIPANILPPNCRQPLKYSGR